MKEIDFLPQWYKDNKRRQSHVRRQYIVLVVVFLVMMAFNATATHRASRAAAEVARLETQRLGAEAVPHQFDTLTKKLNVLKARASVIEQVDSCVDVAAVLAEMSYIIGASVVLRKVDMLAERFGPALEKEQPNGSALRIVGKTEDAGRDGLLGQVKFRIVLAGVAARPADVADLVLRLDGSAYFQGVHLSFCDNTQASGGGKLAPTGRPEAGAVPTSGRLGATEFEMVCYLANYQEMQP